jgi:hypothetical protein
MKKALIMGSAILIAVMIAGCAGPKRYHEQPLGDPSGYNAHFPDMDRNGDDLVTWEEFKARFPDTNANVFQALDMNKDNGIDHHEWQNFKKAHCPGHNRHCCSKGHHDCMKDHHKHQ